jgi:hypothetical protein
MWGSLISISFLLAIPCKVTGFSAEETCEDFPLSILLDRSSGVSSFPATSYTLFVSVSSWEEIFCFRYSCPSSSGRCIHGILVSWCVIVPWLIDGRWSRSCFEPVCSVLHMCIELLLLYRHVPPIFVVLWFRPPHDVGVHGIGQGTGEDTQYQFLVDIVSRVTYQLFKFCNKCVEVPSF